MDNQFTIFFIDDEYLDFLNVLKDAGIYKSIDIIPFNSVEKAIETLRESGGCDGILLDLAFPTGTMQGKEGLEIIKREFPKLPVIILTASYESNDIKTAVDCIKIGALNYMGKASLNPEAMMEQMSVASNKYLNERIDLQKTNLKTALDKIPKNKIYQSGANKSFAFKLAHLTEANPLNNASLQEEAFAWHTNFFQTLAFSYQQNAQIELIYRKKTGSELTEVYIIFTVKGADADSSKNFFNLYQDILPLFLPVKDDKKQVYFFSDVPSDGIKDLKYESKQFRNKTAFSQQLIELKPIKQTGFKTLDTENDSFFIPILNLPNSGEINGFLQLFSKSEMDGELSIQLHPQFLGYKEKRILNLITQKIDAMVFENIPKTEAVIENVRQINENYLSLFKCKMVLRSKAGSGNLHNKLRISISTSFDKDPYDFLEQKTKIPKNSLIYNYYTAFTALATLRLPIPKEGGISGIQSQNPNTIRMPDLKKNSDIQLGIKKRIGETIPINLSTGDLTQHLYIMGQTGTGKTTLLKSIINSLLKLKKGFMLIDPHGDLSEEVNKMIKGNPDLNSKFIFLNPSDPECSVRLNFLKYDLKFPEQKSIIVNELFKVIGELYDLKVVGGPIFEQFFKYGMLALLDKGFVDEYGFPTFKEFKNFYYNDDFRNHVVDIILDKEIVDFFKNASKMTGEASFQNIAPYITSKLNRIADDYYLSKFVNTKEDNLDLRKVIDDGKILIVKLDKGRLGSENVTLFGQLLVNKFYMAAMSRADIPKSLRNDFYVIIDEFQNFSKGDIGSSLSELRKYGIVMALANQTIWQLGPNIANSVLGNVGNLIFFRPGIKDYELLRYYVEPDFNREDIIKLANFNCVARLMVDNIPTDPFIFQTEVLKK